MRQQRGIALLVVLICLALVTLLTVAFFESVRRTSLSSAVKASTEDASRAAESALGLVISQIKAGTQGGVESTWTSQPGAIRTFSNDTGNPESVFKLYSAPKDAMVVPGSNFDVEDQWAPNDWPTKPGIWVDLNAPVRDTYPIVSPEALETPGGGGTYTGPRIEGFSVDENADPVKATGANNELPMPVRWMYQLKDGTLVTPEETGANGANGVTTIPGATRANPPVARFAFWTDDDTCKLNINTASDGAFWDTPYYTTPASVYFQNHGPINYEFQRTPGHPATTSLRPVLWSYLGLSSPDQNINPTFDLDKDGQYYYYDIKKDGPDDSVILDSIPDDVDAYIKTVLGDDASGTLDPGLSPRAVWGGSKNGTQSFSNTSVPWSSLFTLPLYTSLDEMLFTIPDPGAAATAGTARPRLKIHDASKANAFNSGEMDALRFFLTTSSRAPEVNLYNRPRVSIWPVDDPNKVNPVSYYPDEKDTQSPVDKLMTFCSTIGGKIYYLTRNNPESTKDDWTARNKQLYTYLRRSLELNSPLHLPGQTGAGVSFVDKFGSSVVNQQLVSIFDYIRSGINTVDSTAAGGGTNRFRYAFAKAPDGTGGGRTGGGEILPLVHPINGLRGYGRFPTLQQVALMFIAKAADQPPVLVDEDHKQLGTTATPNPMHPYTNPPDPTTGYALGDRYPTIGKNTHAGLRYLTIPNPDPDPNKNGIYNLKNDYYIYKDDTNPANDIGLYETQIEPMLVLRPVINMAGLPDVSPNMQIQVEGLDGFQANGQPLFPGKSLITIPVNTGNFRGQIINFEAIFTPSNLNKLIGNVVKVGGDINNQGDRFSFTGATLKITFKLSTGEVIQAFNVEFPSGTFPTPRLPSFVSTHYEGYTTTPMTPEASPFPRGPLSIRGRFEDKSWNHKKNTLDPGPLLGAWVYPEADVQGEYGARTVDTVRAMEVAGGDTRITGALNNVPKDFFVPHVFYGDLNKRSAHSLRDDENQFAAVRGATVQPLVTDLHAFSSTYNAASSGPIKWPELDPDWMHSSKWYQRVLANRNDRAINTLFPQVPSSVDMDNNTFRTKIWNNGGDFDTVLPVFADGAMLNKADEGTFNYFATGTTIHAGGRGLYPIYRQVPSAVMFGSIPSRLNTGYGQTNVDQAWKTFVFSPNPNSGDNHVDLGANPPDYALLDLFWMPVVDPYAISEPLSTDGKVNMNYQMVPFSYIKRDAALRGVLRSVMFTAVEDKWIEYYKGHAGTSGHFGDAGGPFDTVMGKTGDSGGWGFRYPIHCDETLKQFKAKFDDKKVFLSESEICSIWLYPAERPKKDTPDATKTALVSYDATATNIKSWWYDKPGVTRKSLTADNVRERPYALLYPRLTTRSNSYTVHVRAQALAPTFDRDGNFVEKPETVLSEWRGHYGVERYVDPNDPDLKTVDFAVDTTKSLSPYYKIRVLNTTRFMP